MTTVCNVAFWCFFNEQINKLCEDYHFIQNNTEHVYDISVNADEKIVINTYGHPQCEEIELYVMVIEKNDIIYKKTYLLYDRFESNETIIPKPMDEFINELLDDVIKNIR